MKIMGFDLGLQISNPSASATIESIDGMLHWIWGRCYCPLARAGRYARVDWLIRRFDEDIVSTRPDCVAYEVPFVGVDPQVAITFGHLGGGIRAACARLGIPCYGYAPTSIKKITTGSGGASKDFMIMAVESLFSTNLAGFGAIKVSSQARKLHDFRSHVADAAGAAYSACIEQESQFSQSWLK